MIYCTIKTYFIYHKLSTLNLLVDITKTFWQAFLKLIKLENLLIRNFISQV